MCIKWGQSTSSFFTVSNGVRQGGILSPRLFAVYVDDLSKHLHDARSGCFIEHQCIKDKDKDKDTLFQVNITHS